MAAGTSWEKRGRLWPCIVAPSRSTRARHAQECRARPGLLCRPCPTQPRLMLEPEPLASRR
eukprot:9134005-Alexandrium_andersonii.AAC.1